MFDLSLKRNLYSLLTVVLINAAFAFVAAFIKKATKQEKRKFGKTNHYFEHARREITAAKYLTPKIYSSLGEQVAFNAFSLKDLLAVREKEFRLFDENGENLVFVKDAESCEAFQALFDSLTCLPHKKYNEKLLSISSLQDSNIKDKRILSCTMSANRNLSGFCFPLSCSSEEREKVGKLLLQSLLGMQDFNGHVTNVSALDRLGQLDKLGLQQDVYAVRLPVSSASGTDLEGRWIWWSRDRKCKVYINFRDHIAVVASQRGGDLRATFNIYATLFQRLEKKLREMNYEFLVSKLYGYLTSLLRDVGPGFRVEVKVKLSCLNKDSRLARIVHALPVICLPGVDAFDKDVFIVSNKTKINHTEVEILQEITKSLVLLLELDMRIHRGENVNDILP